MKKDICRLEELELIWNNTNDAIFIIGQNGEVLNANPSFTQLLGWQLDEVKGVSSHPFFNEAFSKEEHEQLLERFKKGEIIKDFETQRKRKDGSYVHILASYRSINKGSILAVVMYKDITEKKKLQEELQAKEYCYRALVEYSPAAIFVMKNEKVAFANSAAASLFGVVSTNELIDKSIWNFVNKKQSTLPFINLFNKQVYIKPTPVIEKLVRVNRREERWVEAISIPIMYGGDIQIQVILRDVTEKKHYDDELEFRAKHDPLTGLLNRRAFLELLDDTIVEANRAEDLFAVLYIDMDKFKDINDFYGHEAGDELLVQLSTRMKENVRQSDVLCRIGGDEFLVLLKDIEETAIKNLVNRMHKSFQQPFRIKDHQLIVTTSIGIAIYPHDAKSAKEIIRAADQALYKAKESRNKYRFYKQEFSWL